MSFRFDADFSGIPQSVRCRVVSMVEVKMGAHHCVNIVRLHAGCHQPVEPVGVEHCHVLDGPLLVVAVAGVDEDRLLRGADHP